MMGKLLLVLFLLGILAVQHFHNFRSSNLVQPSQNRSIKAAVWIPYLNSESASVQLADRSLYVLSQGKLIVISNFTTPQAKIRILDVGQLLGCARILSGRIYVGQYVYLVLTCLKRERLIKPLELEALEFRRQIFPEIIKESYVLILDPEKLKVLFSKRILGDIYFASPTEHGFLVVTRIFSFKITDLQQGPRYLVSLLSLGDNNSLTASSVTLLLPMAPEFYLGNDTLVVISLTGPVFRILELPPRPASINYSLYICKLKLPKLDKTCFKVQVQSSSVPRVFIVSKNEVIVVTKSRELTQIQAFDLESRSLKLMGTLKGDWILRSSYQSSEKFELVFQASNGSLIVVEINSASEPKLERLSFRMLKGYKLLYFADTKLGKLVIGTDYNSTKLCLQVNGSEICEALPGFPYLSFSHEIEIRWTNDELWILLPVMVHARINYLVVNVDPRGNIHQRILETNFAKLIQDYLIYSLCKDSLLHICYEDLYSLETGCYKVPVACKATLSVFKTINNYAIK